MLQATFQWRDQVPQSCGVTLEFFQRTPELVVNVGQCFAQYRMQRFGRIAPNDGSKEREWSLFAP